MPDQNSIESILLERQRINDAVAGKRSASSPQPVPGNQPPGGFKLNPAVPDVRSLIEAMLKSGISGQRNTDIYLPNSRMSLEELMRPPIPANDPYPNPDPKIRELEELFEQPYFREQRGLIGQGRPLSVKKVR